MINAAHEFGKYPIKTEAPLEELEKRYANYWDEPYRMLIEEGVA
jgi:hypothetical protein